MTVSFSTSAESFREAYFESKLMPRLGLEEWELRGHPRFEDLLREETCQLLEDQELLDDYDDLLAKGEAFIKALGWRLAIGNLTWADVVPVVL